MYRQYTKDGGKVEYELYYENDNGYNDLSEVTTTGKVEIIKQQMKWLDENVKESLANQ